MPKFDPDPYDIDFSALTPLQVEEVEQSIRWRELRMLGMSEKDLELLDARIAERDAYSPMQRALLDASRNAVRQKAQAAEARYHQAQLRRWDVFSGRVAPQPAPNAYRYWAGMQRLRELALHTTPTPQYTVSSYCRWIHSLYSRGSDSERAKLYGKFVERSVAKSPKMRGHPDWVEEYHDPLDVKPSPERISALTVHGRPLWGAPDHVYRNVDNGEIVIIERKASDAPIPENGWPDLRAQLWCYAQIDRWRDASSIRLVAEIWRYDYRGLTLRTAEGGVMRWMYTDRIFHQENAELFSLYRGLCEATSDATTAG